MKNITPLVSIALAITLLNCSSKKLHKPADDKGTKKDNQALPSPSTKPSNNADIEQTIGSNQVEISVEVPGLNPVQPPIADEPPLEEIGDVVNVDSKEMMVENEETDIVVEENISVMAGLEQDVQEQQEATRILADDQVPTDQAITLVVQPTETNVISLLAPTDYPTPTIEQLFIPSQFQQPTTLETNPPYLSPPIEKRSIKKSKSSGPRERKKILLPSQSTVAQSNPTKEKTTRDKKESTKEAKSVAKAKAKERNQREKELKEALRAHKIAGKQLEEMKKLRYPLHTIRSAENKLAQTENYVKVARKKLES